MEKKKATLDDLLNYVNSQEAEEQINILYGEAERKKETVGELQIIKAFGLSLTQYHKLENKLKDQNTSEEDSKKITQIIDKIKSFNKTNKIINDYSIKNGARISKTAMLYMLKEKEEEQDLVIINVNVVGDEIITVKKLKEKK